MEKMFAFESLCAEADRLKNTGRSAEAGQISNQIATDIMGWHVSTADPKRLWCDASGQAIVVSNNSVCMHPWVRGQNTYNEVSFSPGLNYHANWIDWRNWVRDALKAVDFQPIRDVWQAYDCPVCVTDFDLDKEQLVYMGKTFTCAGCGKELVAGVDVSLETGIEVRTGLNDCDDDQRQFVELPESEEALLAVVSGKNRVVD